MDIARFMHGYKTAWDREPNDASTRVLQQTGIGSRRGLAMASA